MVGVSLRERFGMRSVQNPPEREIGGCDGLITKVGDQQQFRPVSEQPTRRQGSVAEFCVEFLLTFFVAKPRD